MQAAAALSGYRGICLGDRRLASSGSSDYPRVTCAEDEHLAHLQRLIKDCPLSRRVPSFPLLLLIACPSSRDNNWSLGHAIVENVEKLRRNESLLHDSRFGLGEIWVNVAYADDLDEGQIACRNTWDTYCKPVYF